ncbi:MAG: 2-oxoacid:acceptor oxidoreductase family protein [Deltaproteobacteria bacterium]|nr:2-oxoacid:acceptor oxidoreductase family protein [Deltaproteobacteria bacterium]
MNMQIAITGRGGQGVLFLTRLLGECALELGREAISAETHGMAMRGGSVFSTLKVGSFLSPLIRNGQADVLLALDPETIETDLILLSPRGIAFLNSREPGRNGAVDATGLASGLGHPLAANLVLLGFALGRGGMFCHLPLVESVTGRMSPGRARDLNLEALRLGFGQARR